jgi:VIT1/CCC1 family predicted Fe2+/Mn2+ transporter
MATGNPQLVEPTGFRRIWRALRQLFHEMTGALFAILAFAWLNSALRAWSRDVAPWLIVLTVAVALLFVFFAVTSFLRARKL